MATLLLPRLSEVLFVVVFVGFVGLFARFREICYSFGIKLSRYTGNGSWITGRNLPSLAIRFIMWFSGRFLLAAVRDICVQIMRFSTSQNTALSSSHYVSTATESQHLHVNFMSVKNLLNSIFYKELYRCS